MCAVFAKVSITSLLLHISSKLEYVRNCGQMHECIHLHKVVKKAVVLIQVTYDSQGLISNRLAVHCKPTEL